jgi:chromosomal replication initiation ATPase DnaA
MRQLPLPFVHEPNYERMAFLEAPSNAEALALLEREQAWPMHRLAIWGGEGCGKTHLLHRWARQNNVRVLDGATLALAPPSGPIAIDDADMAGERSLLHMLNAAAEAGFPLLMASRAAPARWAVGLPDLASRLRAMLAVEIRAPDDDLLRALLASLFAQRQLPVAEAVQDYLLLRLPRHPAALREAVARLDRRSLASGGRITRALAASITAEWDEATEPSHVHENIGWPVAASAPDLPGLL